MEREGWKMRIERGRMEDDAHTTGRLTGDEDGENASVGTTLG